MAQQREVGVVEVEGMGGGAVGERGPHGARAPARADHGAERRPALGEGDGLEDARGRIDGSRQHHAEAVEDGAPGRLHGRRGAVFPAALGDEVGDGRGGVHGGEPSTSGPRAGPDDRIAERPMGPARRPRGGATFASGVRVRDSARTRDVPEDGARLRALLRERLNFDAIVVVTYAPNAVPRR